MASAKTPIENNEESRTGFSQLATGLADGTKGLISSVEGRVKDAATSIAHSAGDAASFVGQKAQDATAAVGGNLNSLGGKIRANTPHTGMVGEASAGLAKTLENTGHYLQEEGLNGIAKDLTNLIRRNPLPAILGGIGIGFLIGRVLTRRS